MRFAAISAVLFFCLFSNVFAQSTGTSTAEASRSVLDKMKFNGTFRYRHQSAKKEFADVRNLQRIYVTFGTQVAIEENILFGFRLMSATGANGGNQTLGDSSSPGFPRRYIGIDQAYLDFKPVSEVSLMLGKMPQFFFNAGKNQLILDQDLTPEGVGLKAKYKITEGGLEVFTNLGSFIIKEKYSGTEDAIDAAMNVAELGFKIPMDSVTLTLGGGVYSFSSVQGDLVTSMTSDSPSTARGNSLNASNQYINQYQVNHYGLELAYKTGDLTATLFGDVLKNAGASNEQNGSVFGLALAYQKWSANLQSIRLEKDATIAVYTDSDFADGETNIRGNSLGLKYKLSNNVTAGITTIKSEQNVATTATTYDRTHVDIIATF